MKKNRPGIPVPGTVGKVIQSYCKSNGALISPALALTTSEHHLLSIQAIILCCELDGLSQIISNLKKCYKYWGQVTEL